MILFYSTVLIRMFLVVIPVRYQYRTCLKKKKYGTVQYRTGTTVFFAKNKKYWRVHLFLAIKF